MSWHTQDRYGFNHRSTPDKFEAVIDRIDEELQTFKAQNDRHLKTIADLENRLLVKTMQLEAIVRGNTQYLEKLFDIDADTEPGDPYPDEAKDGDPPIEPELL